MIGVSVLMFVLALDRRVGRLEGVCCCGYCGDCSPSPVQGRREEIGGAAGTSVRRRGESAQRARDSSASSSWSSVGGSAGRRGASAWVDSVPSSPGAWTSELIIGLTVVAIGTSSPEIVTSVIASLRGETDIAVGNAVGSNLFNILVVLGLAAIVSPSGREGGACGPGLRHPGDDRRDGGLPADLLHRLPDFGWEGALFLCYAVAYVAYLILGATQHPAQRVFGSVMLYFVLPLTVITLPC